MEVDFLSWVRDKLIPPFRLIWSKGFGISAGGLCGTAAFGYSEPEHYKRAKSYKEL